MKKLLHTICLLVICQYAFSQELGYEWHFAAQGVEDDLLLNSTIDNLGNSILVGNFETEITVGDTTYTGEEFAKNGLIIKLDAQGEVIWSRVLRTDPFDDVFLFDVAVDAANNILVAGSHWGFIDADPTEEEFILDSGSNDDIYFSKFDQDGNLVFATNITVGNDNEERVLDMEIAEDGTIYCGGYVDVSANRTSDDLILFQILPQDSTIEIGWNYYVSTSGKNDGIENLTICGDFIYITGGFTGSVDFAPGDDELILDAGDTQDMFVIKLTKTGEIVWVSSFESQSDGAECIGESLQCDTDGNIYITGDYDGVVDFDPGEGKAMLDGFLQSFVLKLSPEGSFQWVWDQDDLFSREVVLNASGDPFIASEQSEFVTIRKLSSDGQLAWINQLDGGSTFDISLRGIDFDSEENLYIGTNFSGTFQYDPITKDSIQAIGNFDNDMLYIKLRQDPTTNAQDKLVARNFNIYPNPVKDIANLEFRENQSKIQLEIHDVQGRLLWRENYQNRSRIEISFPYVPGIYFLKYRLENGEQAVVKLVK